MGRSASFPPRRNPFRSTTRHLLGKKSWPRFSQSGKPRSGANLGLERIRPRSPIDAATSRPL
jgi:hypothetical protein